MGHSFSYFQLLWGCNFLSIISLARKQSCVTLISSDFLMVKIHFCFTRDHLSADYFFLRSSSIILFPMLSFIITLIEDGPV